MEGVELALLPAAGDAPEPLELVPAQGVQPLVPGCVLHKPSLVTESIVAILPHAVEVGLMLPVVAVRKLTVLVEPVSHVPLWDWFIFEHPHRVLKSDLLLVHGHHVLLQVHRRLPLLLPGRPWEHL